MVAKRNKKEIEEINSDIVCCNGAPPEWVVRHSNFAWF
jgi:hypothetical protein